MADFPHAMLQAIESGSAILFLGAGASMGASHPKNQLIPSGEKLRDEISDKFLNGELKEKSLAEVSAFAVNESSLTDVQIFIKDRFIDFVPADFHKIIPTFRWHSIVSTNYDLIIERAYQDVQDRLQQPVPFVKNGQHIEKEMKRLSNGVHFLKLHGCVRHISDQDIPMILATEQYAKYKQNRSRLFDRLKDWGREFPIIFCGYSIEDSNIQEILFELIDLGQLRPSFYLVKPDISDYEMRYWQSKRIVPIDMKFSDFLLKIDNDINTTNRKLSSLMSSSRSSLTKFYSVNDVVESDMLLSFLAEDADHVRPSIPTTPANPKMFYKGFDEGWGAIEVELDIPRNVTDSLVIEAVLTEENEREQVELFVIKGPAGNGKSIALKRAAWAASHDFEELVLFVKEGGCIHKEAIAEIANYTNKRIYIFIDRPAFKVDEISEMILFAQRNSILLTVITAERDAEWNVRCEKLDGFVTKEFHIRYLSEQEINMLISKLEKYDGLGLLKDYSDEERIRAFTERAERQLLVALHEVTLGKAFEDIVYDEYKRIIPAEAQQLYLDICTLNRLGVGIRAGVISRISGLTFVDFQKRLFKPLEYIVHFIFDKYSTDRLFTARHQRVAEIVFDRVLVDPEEKYDQLLRLLNGLNIDFNTDHHAFKQLVRGRTISDLFKSQELGRSFYDAAIKLVGEDPFLLQQRAIFEMEHRGGDLSVADPLIRRSHELEPKNKSIIHTLTTLLRRQANESNNDLYKRTQREKAQAMLKGLKTNGDVQSYAFHTSAQIYLDEIKDTLHSSISAADPMEEKQIVELIKNTEKNLNEGMQRFPNNEYLLALDAEFKNTIKEDKKAENALKKAFAKNPRMDWIACRLASLYVASNEIEKAFAVLIKCVQDNPSSKKAHFELGRLYENHGSSDNKQMAKEHYRRGYTDGDQSYEAQFRYARELFLAHDYEAAQKIFYNLKNAPISPTAKNKVRDLIEKESGEPEIYTGHVSNKDHSFLFIDCKGFQKNIFAHTSNIKDEDWNKISRDTKLIFNIAFSMKGPQAVNINII